MNKAASSKVQHLGHLLHAAGHSVTRDLLASVTSPAASTEQQANYTTAAAVVNVNTVSGTFSPDALLLKVCLSWNVGIIEKSTVHFIICVRLKSLKSFQIRLCIYHITDLVFPLISTKGHTVASNQSVDPRRAPVWPFTFLQQDQVVFCVLSAQTVSWAAEVTVDDRGFSVEYISLTLTL